MTGEEATMTERNRNLGRRIRGLREEAGISQNKLAQMLDVSRPTITQMELGARKVSIDELVRLSEIFNVSVESMLGLGKEPEVVLARRKKGEKAVQQIRISVPWKNLEKFKEVLLYILSKVGSKSNIGETVLYKLLYFIDFDHYEKYEEQLIGATYLKNDYGPTPIEFRKIVDEMIGNKDIEKVESEYFSFRQRKYLPRRTPDLSKLRASELEVIDDVLNRLSDMNATQISEYSHGDVPWLTTDKGKTIEYESVFYRTAPYSVRQYD